MLRCESKILLNYVCPMRARAKLKFTAAAAACERRKSPSR